MQRHGQKGAAMAEYSQAHRWLGDMLVPGMQHGGNVLHGSDRKRLIELYLAVRVELGKLCLDQGLRARAECHFISVVNHGWAKDSDETADSLDGECFKHCVRAAFGLINCADSRGLR